MDVGASVIVDLSGLDALIHRLVEAGYDTRGPVVRDGAIMPGVVKKVTDLPAGYHDEQQPGWYRLAKGADAVLFGWAVGPGSWKAEFFPPAEIVWQASVGGGDLPGEARGPEGPARKPVAVIGARPCDVAALEVLDRVLSRGGVADTRYEARRAGTFVIVAECATPSATCFCPSTGTGPAAGHGFDLALTELLDDDGHRFVLRVGSVRGAEVLAGLSFTAPRARDLDRRRQVLSLATGRMARRLDTEGLPELLAGNSDHPRWTEVAERCLACGNCTLVCPTCFCSDVRDTTDLSGDVTRSRTWSSCFDLDHSYLHGGPVRSSMSSRYRQWMTHKLSTWWDQFGTSGCVGCGRCISWCPVGIDITEEAAAIRRAASAP